MGLLLILKTWQHFDTFFNGIKGYIYKTIQKNVCAIHNITIQSFKCNISVKFPKILTNQAEGQALRCML